MDARREGGELGPLKEGKDGWHEWATSRAACVEIEQKAGETIFVPSGWYHEVENLTDCISINHNWCNSSNLPSVFEALCAAVDATEEALEDVKEMMSAEGGDWQAEWHETVQRVVEADQGWAWKGFWNMVKNALQRPPAATQCSPDAQLFRSRVKDCVTSYQARPEHSWLNDESVSLVSRHCEEHLMQ